MTHFTDTALDGVQESACFGMIWSMCMNVKCIFQVDNKI